MKLLCAATGKVRESALRAVAVGGVVVWCVLPAAVAGARDGSADLRIESDPSGASVETVTGQLGTTPLTVAQRDLYPNRYPPQRTALYGKVIIRRAGCADLVRRVTLDDIREGLRVRLTCSTAAAGAATGLPPSAPEPAQPGPARRLRQLQVLQELLDDGVISAQQENELRRRILERPLNPRGAAP